jgi:phage recombination protein Bet
MSDTDPVTRPPAPLQLVEPRQLMFSAEQRTMIKDLFAKDATDSEFAVLIEMARLKRLNPLAGQVFFVSRNVNLGTYDQPRWGKKWSIQCGIEGFRSKAEENPAYDGQSPKDFVFDASGARLISCTVSVYRKDRSHPFVATVYFDEYVQLVKGKPTEMWLRKPRIMLGKCAEAAALRMAFPEELGGVHAPEEMQDEEPAPVEPAKAPKAPEHQQQVKTGVVLPPEGSPTSPTPVELFEHLTEAVNVAVSAAELRLIYADAKKLPPEMATKVQDLTIAKKAAIDAATEKLNPVSSAPF